MVKVEHHRPRKQGVYEGELVAGIQKSLRIDTT
jgi:hypothetical protein